MPYYVAFDTAHKPRGKIDENLTELRDFLNANGFECYNFLEAPITQSSLKPYDILVFVCPDFSKISSLEITEISSWLREDGGGLLLMSHAGGDKGRNSNLSELSQNFGIAYENDQVLDSTYNLGMENMPVVTAFIPPHPITNGISSLCYRSGCSLMVLGNAISIASSNETSEPFSSPLICVAEADKGRVCAIGSYEMFRDKVGGGFSSDDHASLAYNIFNWLISEYRMELRAEGVIPEVAPQPKSSSLSTSESIPTTERRGKVDINFSMKISRKSELFELLKIFQNQIDTIKNTIDKLITAAEASEEEILELRDNYESSFNTTQNNSASPEINDSTVISVPEPSTTPPKPIDIFDEPLDTNLTSLPPKPASLQPKSEIEIPKFDDSRKLIARTKSKKKPKKSELLAEKKNLESKINSVKNLLDFVQKKHEAGDLDDKSFQKRITQLKTDLKKAQNRIDEINTML